MTTAASTLQELDDGSRIHEVSLKQQHGGNTTTRIARGAFGEITLGLDTQRRRLVAVKTILPPSNDDGDEEEFNEVTALRLLQPHDHICPLLAVFPNRQGFGAGTMQCLALDYCPVDLQLVLEYRRRRLLPLLSMPIIRRLTLDMFRGLAHVHANMLIHGDIKPGNLLISRNGTLQLCDFGLCQRVKKESAAAQNGSSTTQQQRRPKALCTLHYRPPELLLGGSAKQTSIDVYSAGCVVAELLQGKTLFAGRTAIDQVARVFGNLNTVKSSSSLTLQRLPDWHAFQIPTSANSEPSWAEILPRCTEAVGLQDFLQTTVALAPEGRLKSEAVTRHEWLLRDDDIDQATTARMASRAQLLEVVPTELAESLILEPPPPPPPEGESSTSTAVADDRWRVADEQILQLAASRRTILSNLETWGKEV